MYDHHSYLVRFKTVHNEQEGWSWVFRVLVVWHDDVVIHIVWFSSVKWKFSEVGLGPFEECCGTGLESIKSFWFLFLNPDHEFFHVLLEVGWEWFQVEASFFVSEGIDEIDDFSDSACSSLSSLFLIFVCSTESVTTSDINVNILLGDQSCFNFSDNFLVERFDLVRVRDEFFIGEDVLENSHLGFSTNYL